MIRWLLVHTGTWNEPGPYYAFWSGFGSDLGEVALLGSLIAVFRHRNCHIKVCWRIGKPVEGSAFLCCHKHHQDQPGVKRNIPEGMLKEVVER